MTKRIADAARLVWRAFNRFLAHNGPDRAAVVSYYTLLSLLPMLIFLISIGVAVLGSFEDAFAGTLVLIGGVVVHLDENAIGSLRGFVERAIRFQWPGILILAWTAKRTFGALFSALEAVFEVPGRGFAKGNLIALAMVLVTGVGLLATLALTLLVAGVEGMLLRFAGPTETMALKTLSVLFVTQLLPVIITLVFFFIIYRIVPGRAISIRSSAFGAMLATALWETAKAGFSYYLRNWAHYAGLYGTLEAVIVLALWLELSASIVLFCGEVAALLENSVTNAKLRTSADASAA